MLEPFVISPTRKSRVPQNLVELYHSIILPFGALPLQEMSFLQLSIMTGSEHNGTWLGRWPSLGELLPDSSALLFDSPME